MTRAFKVLAACFLLPACDGPHENAGERIDAMRGETGGESSIVAGPAEKRGEQMDRALESNRSAAPADGE